MQTVRRLKEQAVTGRHCRLILDNMIEHRLVDALGVNPVGGLPELVRIAQQYKVVCRACYRENVWEGHLPGLVDEKIVQLGGEAGASEKPRRTSNDLNLIRGYRGFDGR